MVMEPHLKEIFSHHGLKNLNGFVVMIPRRFFAITVPYKSRSGAGSDNPFVKGSCNNGIDPLKSHEKASFI